MKYYTDYQITWDYELAEDIDKKHINLMNQILKDIKKEDVELSTQLENTKSTLRNLFVRGKGNDVDGVKNTLWAGYNAITEYADFHKTTRGDRVQSLLFGSGADMKRKAYDEACLMVK